MNKAARFFITFFVSIAILSYSMAGYALPTKGISIAQRQNRVKIVPGKKLKTKKYNLNPKKAPKPHIKRSFKKHKMAKYKRKHSLKKRK